MVESNSWEPPQRLARLNLYASSSKRHSEACGRRNSTYYSPPAAVANLRPPSGLFASTSRTSMFPRHSSHSNRTTTYHFENVCRHDTPATTGVSEGSILQWPSVEGVLSQDAFRTLRHCDNATRRELSLSSRPSATAPAAAPTRNLPAISWAGAMVSGSATPVVLEGRTVTE